MGPRRAAYQPSMFETWLALFVGSAALVAVALLAQGVAARGRWGWIERPAGELGEGAYRRAHTSETKARPAPLDIVSGAVVASVWGIITLFVFVPAGGLCAVIVSEQPGASLAVLFSAAAALSGLLLAGALVVVSQRLVRRGDDSIDDALRVVRFSHAHHVAVFLGFGLMAAVMEAAALPAYLLALAIPCGAGLAAGQVLRVTAQRAAEIRRAELFAATTT